MTRQNKKIYIALGFICLIFLIIILRAGQLQILKHKEYKKAGMMLSNSIKVEKAERGKIYDRNGNLLADVRRKYDLWVTKSDVGYQDMNDEQKKNFDEQLTKIAEAFDINKETFYKQLNGPDSSFAIKKDIPHEVFKQYEDIIPSNWVKPYGRDERYYPYGHLASSVLGIVNKDGVGIKGVESYYNDLLKGVDGKSIRYASNHQNPLSVSNHKKYEAMDGDDLYLTIDATIQEYAQRWTQKCLEELDATAAMSIVMDTKTGQILAMVTMPTFDLNKPYEIEGLEEASGTPDYNKILFNAWSNKTIEMIYEPGSIGKIITASAGIEEGAFTRNSTFSDNDGTVRVEDRTIYCWYYPGHHGTQNITQAMINSCNPAFVKMQQTFGAKVMYDYIERFGLTQRVKVDLPEVAYPLTIPRKGVGNVEAANMSFGYSYSISPLQMLVALNSIVNDGKLLQPKVLLKSENANNAVSHEFEPTVVRHVVSKNTASQVKVMLNEVFHNLAEGIETGDIEMCAKTGTANILDENGEYSKRNNLSFFVSAPYDDPQYSMIFVALDPKKARYSSEMARYTLGLMRDIVLTEGIEGVTQGNRVVVPSLLGKTQEEAKTLLSNVGLHAVIDSNVKSDAVVVSQIPKTGQEIYPGASVLLRFEVPPKEKENGEESEDKKEND